MCEYEWRSSACSTNVARSPFNCIIAFCPQGICSQAWHLCHVSADNHFLNSVSSSSSARQWRVEEEDKEDIVSVFNDPVVDLWPTEGLIEPIGQVRIHKPERPIIVYRCIVTMVSPGHTRWLDIFLSYLKANGGCNNAAIVVFAVDADAKRAINVLPSDCRRCPGTKALDAQHAGAVQRDARALRGGDAGDLLNGNGAC